MPTSPRQQRRNIAATGRATEVLAQVLDAGDIGGRDGLRDVGVEWSNEVKVVLSQPGRGRVYERSTPGKGKRHRASAPGDPPAVDEGRLRNSYTWADGRDSSGAYFVEVGTNVEYAPHLEFGTRRMAARPHLRVATENITRKVANLVAREVEDAQRAEVRRLPAEVSLG